jgi:MFS family permease
VLGLVLLCIAAGTTVATPLAGLVISRLGEARTVAIMSLVSAAGLAAVAIGYTAGVAPVAAGLFGFGFGMSTWDVAMNVQGAAVEQALGRAIMPRFHAAWSIGTVCGASTGAAMVALGVPVTAHLLAVTTLVAIGGPTAVRGFLPAPGRHAHQPAAHEPAAHEPAAHQPGSRRPSGTGDGTREATGDGTREATGDGADYGTSERREPAAKRGPLAAWTEPRTLLIGLFVLCMTFAEGTGNDWLSLAVIGGYHTSATLGTITFAAFLGAMTTGRWFGPRLIDRGGRVLALRCCAAIALCGLALIELGGLWPVALAGAVLLGLGVSLGFPVGISSAADDPAHAPGRVATTASLGYAAFLAGPPTIGFLADQVGVLRAISVTGLLLAVAFGLAGVTAPAAPAAPAAAPAGEPAAPLRPVPPA